MTMTTTKIDKKTWNKLLNHIRSKVLHLYDPSTEFKVEDNIASELQTDHQGFYIGVVDKNGNEITTVGFMQDGLDNVFQSADIVVQKLFNDLQKQKISRNDFRSFSVYLEVIRSCKYIINPLEWNEEKDGVYFMWGQKYSAICLPYQVKLRNKNKIDLMDQLVSWDTKLPSNFWRLPEGMCFRLRCESFPE